MKFILIGHDYQYETQTTAQIFYPNEKFERLDICPAELKPLDGFVVVSELLEGKCQSYVFENGEVLSQITKDKSFATGFAIDGADKVHQQKQEKSLVIETIYACLKTHTGFKPPWGMLTGIRPSKRVYELWNKGLDDLEVLEHMVDNFDTKEEKAALAIEVALSEREIISQNDGSSYGLYIGIPFCPTRCLYCSFTSYPLKQYADVVDKYLDALDKELAFAYEYGKNRVSESVYIGGGTPTTLDERQLDNLLEKVQTSFDLSHTKEFSVEAGRPDTLNAQKLRILKEHNVSRISINPQTMNDPTLVTIGRSHSVNDFLQAFDLARKEGHNNINVDLILGLPGEGLKHVEHTLEEIAKLNPESITVHVLSSKKGSRLKEIDDTDFQGIFQRAAEVENMVELCNQRIRAMGMHPYYMYRQKNMVGNFENVGYCVENHECVYNVQIMEERQTIIAIGAGATTKVVDLETNKIERAFNVKSIEDYIDRISEMVVRKEELIHRR